jgi:tight adherence protein C
MLLLGVVAVAGACVLLAMALGLIGATDKSVRARLAVGQASASAGDPERPELLVREGRSGAVKVIAAVTAVSKVERNIMLAGHPEGLTLGRILVFKPLMALLGFCVLFVLVSNNGSTLNWLVGIAMTIAGFFAPDIIIKRRAEARQLAIQQELADVLDQVTISIEAGLGFEAAFARIGERRSGPLADEIVRAVQDMRLGMSRRDAYQALADRTDSDDLSSFVKAINQAEQYGVSITSVVRNQSAEMRFRRKSRAEAAALKVPVKILFPLIVCIFPVLMIVVLAPAFIQLAKNLSENI